MGDAGVGKTSLIRKYIVDQFDDSYLKTMGAKVSKKTVRFAVNGVSIKADLILWDIAGGEGWSQLLRRSYTTGAQGVIAVCDCTRTDTVSNLINWINVLKDVEGDVPLHVVVNKSDLSKREQNAEDITLFETASDVPYLFTSAKTGDNVGKAFEDLARRIVAERILPRIPSVSVA